MSALVRSKGFCEHCGRSDGTLQHNHIISRSNTTLRYDILNGMCLCAGCHLWWHHQPLEAAKWFENTFPDRYQYLMQAKNIKTFRKVHEYPKILEDIQSKNLSSLTFG